MLASNNKSKVKVKRWFKQWKSGNVTFAVSNTVTRGIWKGTKKAFHLNIKFQCDVCQQSFMFSRDLRRHVQSIHTQKKWNCNICNKVFTLSNTLSRHVKSAHQSSKWQCNFCEKSFHWPSDLLSHKKRVHVESSVHCNLCKRQFADHEALTNHKKEVHFATCGICERRYQIGTSFENHLNSHKDWIKNKLLVNTYPWLWLKQTKEKHVFAQLISFIIMTLSPSYSRNKEIQKLTICLPYQ